MGAGNETVHRFRYALGLYYSISDRILSRKIKHTNKKSGIPFWYTAFLIDYRHMPVRILGMCRIVRSFLGDLNIMRVALQQTGVGDLYELCLFVEQLNGLAAAVTHTGANTAYQLEHGIGNTALVRHTTFYALRHQLLGTLLEVSVLGTICHSSQTAHAAVYLEGTSLIDLGFSRRFLTASQQ